jgi:hypothetical protein
MGTSLTRRRFLNATVIGPLGIAVVTLAAACGQPDPTPFMPGAARVATPGGTPSVGIPSGSPTATFAWPSPYPGQTPAPTPPAYVTMLPLIPTQPPVTITPEPTVPVVYAPLPTSTPLPTPNPGDPYTLYWTVTRYPSVPFSTQSASTVVLATVRQVFPARWTTPDGSRPANPHEAQHTIFRPVIIPTTALRLVGWRQDRSGRSAPADG